MHREEHGDVTSPPSWEFMMDVPTDQPTDQPTDGQVRREVTRPIRKNKR